MITLCFANAKVAVHKWGLSNSGQHFKYLIVGTYWYELKLVDDNTLKVCEKLDSLALKSSIKVPEYDSISLSFDIGVLLNDDGSICLEDKNMYIVSSSSIVNVEMSAPYIDIGSVKDKRYSKSFHTKYVWVDGDFATKYFNQINIHSPDFTNRSKWCKSMWGNAYGVYQLRRYAEQMTSQNTLIKTLAELEYFNYIFDISKYSQKTVNKKAQELIDLTYGARKYSDIPDFLLKNFNNDVIKANILLNIGVDNKEKVKRFKKSFGTKLRNILDFKLVLEILIEIAGKTYDEAIEWIYKVNGGYCRNMAIQNMANFYRTYRNLGYFVPDDWCSKMMRELEYISTPEINSLSFARKFWNELFIRSLNSATLHHYSVPSFLKSTGSEVLYPYYETRMCEMFYYLSLPELQRDNFLIILFEFSGNKSGDLLLSLLDYVSGTIHMVYRKDDGKMYARHFEGEIPISLNGTKNTKLPNGLREQKNMKDLLGNYYEDIVEKINDTFSKKYKEYVMKQLTA